MSDSFMLNILSQLQHETFHNETGRLQAELDDLLYRVAPHEYHTVLHNPLTVRGYENNGQQNAARMLAHSELPLQLQIRCQDGNRIFLVETEAGRLQSLQTLLQTGFSGVHPIALDDTGELPLRSFAQFTFLDRNPEETMSELWMCKLAGLSLPGSWSVCLEAIPLEREDGWIRDQLQAAEILSSQLTVLSRFTSSVSRPVPQEAGAQVSKWQKTADAPQFTASVCDSMDYVNLSISRSKHALHHLNTMLREGGWKVCLSLHCQTREQQETLQSFIRSAFGACGISICWTSAEAARPCTVMTCRQLATVISFPSAETSMGISQGSDLLTGIPSEQFCKPFGILGRERKATAHLLGSILSARSDTPFLMMDPDGDYCYRLNTRVYTVGSGNSLQINPFRFPHNGNLNWHIQMLSGLLAEVWQIDDLHQAVLEKCITQCYVDLGWDLLSGRNYYSSILEEERLYPTFSYLMEEINSLSDRLHQDLALHLDRFLKGTSGMALNHSNAAALDDLISSSESAAMDFSGLVNYTDKLVAMGSVLIQLAQSSAHRTLVLADADLIPSMKTVQCTLERVLDQITAKRAGPVFTSRRINCLPRYLTDSMDGCIIHQISGRDREADLLRYLRPGQGSGDLYSMGQDLAWIRYGSMSHGICFKMDPFQSPSSQNVSAGIMQTHPDEIARHLLEVSADLDQLIRERMEPLYFQVLLDQDPKNLSQALQEELFEQIRSALSNHMLMDLIRGCDRETLILQLTEQGFHRYIRKRSALGYCLQNLVEMYIFRILRLTVRGTALREADWKVLKDFRKNVLDHRYREMILRSRSNLHELICRKAGIYPHSELLVQILADLYRFDPKDSSKEEVSQLVCELAQHYLLKLPDDIQDSLTGPIFRCLQ